MENIILILKELSDCKTRAHSFISGQPLDGVPLPMFEVLWDARSLVSGGVGGGEAPARAAS